jgi:hypothetical protein
MSAWFRMSKCYGVVFVLLFAAEIVIGTLVHDRFVRPFVGDVLVVISIYCGIQTFLTLPRLWTLAGVFLFACLVEVGPIFDPERLDSAPGAHNALVI